MSEATDWASIAAQLPVVFVILVVVWWFIKVLKEERKESHEQSFAERTAFLEELKDERDHRAETVDKLDTTITGFTSGVSDLTHEIKELRVESRGRPDHA